MKHLYAIASLLSMSASAQIINFPDPALKSALLMSADSNGDGEITQAEAAAATDVFLAGTDIVDPSGLEYFTGAFYFYMAETSIVSLDLSPMTGLSVLNVSNCNALESLTSSGLQDMGEISVTENATLQTLLVTGAQQINMSVNVSENPQLTSISFPAMTNGGNSFQISNNDVLANLNIPQLQSAGDFVVVANPQLTALDLSDTSFTSVQVSQNGLTSVNLTNLFVEAQVDLSFNALTSLDLSTLSVGSMGGMIDLSGNNYTQIELVGPWAQADPIGPAPSLKLNNTALTSLHFAQPVILSQLIIQDNLQLQTLSFQNNEFETCQAGYCSIDSFLISGNTALTSVCTDPFEVYALESQFYISGTDWIHQIIGPDITVNENCEDFIYIPDANFLAKLLSSSPSNQVAMAGGQYVAIDANGNGQIEVSEAEPITRLNVSNSSIASLEGIASFENLIRLDCSYNILTSLDVNPLQNLQILLCSNNQLTSLNAEQISNKIRQLNCSYNNLTSLVVPNFYEFEDQGYQVMSLDCSHNQLSQIAFDQQNGREDFSALNLSFNNLTELTLSNMAVYGGANLSDNPLTTLIFDTVYFGPQDPDDSCGLSLNNTNLTQVSVPGGTNFFLSIKNNPNLISIDMKNGRANLHSVMYWDEELQEEYYVLEGVTLENNPLLAMICADEGEVGYLAAIAPDAQVTEYCTFTPGGNYNTISGNVSLTCPESGDIGSSIKIKINNDFFASFTDDQGDYVAYTSYGNQTVSLNLPVPSYFTVTPPNHVFNFATLGNEAVADFCVTPNGTHPDLELTILPTTPARPGFDATYKIIYANKGTETLSGNVTFNFEENILDFVSATQATALQNDGLLSWNFSDLMPFETRVLTIILNVNSPVETPAVNIDDILNFSAAISSAATDETPDDNVFELHQTVVGSYDPNDKLVAEGATISISEVGEYLHYMVRFQNTGNFPAENVVVKDYLPFHRTDFSSLQMIDASHPFRSSFKSGKLEVIFEGINLPPSSTDEAGSQGFIAFKIKSRPTLVVDDTIVNTAYIYFDFNAPIVTNEVVTTVTALSRQEFQSANVNLYPNPTRDQFTIRTTNNLKSISIYNLVGQKIRETPVSGDSEQTVSVADLQSGTYLISIETDKGKTSKKLVKL